MGLQKGVHNLFRGLEASLLPAVPEAEAEGLCARVHDHVLRVLGAGDATAAGALTDWLARIVQTPGVAAPMAPVLVGGRAALFVRWFRLRLVGARYSSDVVDGSPRSMDRLFVHVDSARSVEPTLAAFVGRPVVKCLQFLRAGSEVHEEPNHFSAVFTGPTADILQAVPDRSRFPVFVCCNALCGDVDYFTRLEHHLDNPRVQRAYYQSLMRRPRRGRWAGRPRGPRAMVQRARAGPHLAGAGRRTRGHVVRAFDETAIEHARSRTRRLIISLRVSPSIHSPHTGAAPAPGATGSLFLGSRYEARGIKTMARGTGAP